MLRDSLPKLRDNEVNLQIILCGKIAILCGRIEFLGGRIEFLCGRIEFLCGRIEFLCGRIEFLYGRFYRVPRIPVATGSLWFLGCLGYLGFEWSMTPRIPWLPRMFFRLETRWFRYGSQSTLKLQVSANSVILRSGEVCVWWINYIPPSERIA